jgi:hypothetical protein
MATSGFSFNALRCALRPSRRIAARAPARRDAPKPVEMHHVGVLVMQNEVDLVARASGRRCTPPPRHCGTRMNRRRPCLRAQPTCSPQMIRLDAEPTQMRDQRRAEEPGCALLVAQAARRRRDLGFDGRAPPPPRPLRRSFESTPLVSAWRVGSPGCRRGARRERCRRLERVQAWMPHDPECSRLTSRTGRAPP